MAKTECAICTKEIDVLDKFVGEPMCEECQRNPDNEVFADE